MESRLRGIWYVSYLQYHKRHIISFVVSWIEKSFSFPSSSGKDNFLFYPMTCNFFSFLAAPSESLEINLKVSSAMVEIVRRITTRPRYILAKVH